MKNKILREHFLNPKNMGDLPDSTHSFMIKSETCNDIVKLMLIINKNGIIDDIKGQVFGCGYSIAGTSILTEVVKTRVIFDLGINELEIIEEAKIGIPERHKYCVELALKALNKIIEQYNKGDNRSSNEAS